MSGRGSEAANDDDEDGGAGRAGVAIAQLQEMIETGAGQIDELWRSSVPALRRYGPWLALGVAAAAVPTYFVLQQLADED